MNKKSVNKFGKAEWEGEEDAFKVGVAWIKTFSALFINLMKTNFQNFVFYIKLLNAVHLVLCKNSSSKKRNKSREIAATKCLERRRQFFLFWAYFNNLFQNERSIKGFNKIAIARVPKRSFALIVQLAKIYWCLHVT